MNKTNTNVTFKGNKLTLAGRALKEGETLPPFTLTAQDLSDLRSDSYQGKVMVICSVPSLDTPVCSTEMKRFNQAAHNLTDDLVVLTVSMDLPFAQKRWCGAEGVQHVQTGSDYKYRSFGKAFGVQIEEWGLLGRAVFVVNPQGKIAHLEYVQDVSNEPDYDAALASVNALLEG